MERLEPKLHARRKEGKRHPEMVEFTLPTHLHDEISSILAAVSYTHLRAHETVLDLVCRLLLEKKKHTHLNH